MLSAFRNQDVFIQRSDINVIRLLSRKAAPAKGETSDDRTSHVKLSKGGQSTNITKKSLNSKRFTSMKWDFSVQNNIVSVCCSCLSMVFPYIGNSKYPHGRTNQQQRFKSKRGKISNVKDCVTFHRTTAYHCCHSLFSLEATRSFHSLWMILDQRFLESTTPDRW